MSDYKEELSEFFDFMWGNTEGFVYLPTQNRDTGSWDKKMCPWPKGKATAIDHVLLSGAKGLDVYFAPALFKNPSPTKDSILGTNVLWAEFDGNAPKSWDADEYSAPSSDLQGPDGHSGTPDARRAASGPPSHVHAPVLRVQTSADGHEHVYWRLNELETNISTIESINRSIAYQLQADTSGWDATQILRPPGSFNNKYKDPKFSSKYKEPLPVTIVYKDDRTFTTGDFKGLKPILSLVSDSIDVENLPSVMDIVFKYPWDQKEMDIFRKNSIPEGERSDALMRIGYYCAESGMADEEIYAIVSDAAERWGKFSGRNDRHRRLVDIVNRARLKHPVGLSNFTFQGLLATEAKVLDSKIIYGFQEYVDFDFKQEAWVIEDLLEVGGFGMVAAASNVGKTQFSIQLGICAALGIPFLDWKIPKPQKVVFLSLEMSKHSLQKFLRKIANQYSAEQLKVLEENFKVIPIGEPILLDRAEGVKYLDIILEETKPDGLIIDSVGKLTSGELTTLAAKSLNNVYLSLRAKYGCWLWLIHHNRKAQSDNKKPNQLSDVIGDQYLVAEMTAVITLWDNRKGHIEMNVVKSRLAEQRFNIHLTRNSNLQFDIDTNPTEEQLVELIEDVAERFSL